MTLAICSLIFNPPNIEETRLPANGRQRPCGSRSAKAPGPGRDVSPDTCRHPRSAKDWEVVATSADEGRTIPTCLCADSFYAGAQVNWRPISRPRELVNSACGTSSTRRSIHHPPLNARSNCLTRSPSILLHARTASSSSSIRAPRIRLTTPYP
jgi:hypothetical protein